MFLRLFHPALFKTNQPGIASHSFGSQTPVASLDPTLSAIGGLVELRPAPRDKTQLAAGRSLGVSINRGIPKLTVIFHGYVMS